MRIPTSVADAWTRAEFEQALAKLHALNPVDYAMDMKMNYGQGEWFTYGFAPIVQSMGADGAPIVIGTIAAGKQPGQPPFTPHDVDLLMSLATQAAAAIANVRLFEETQKARDELERRVVDRTSELAQANLILRQQFAERQRAQEALRRERDLVTHIRETSPTGILVRNREGHAIFANSRAEQVLGLTSCAEGEPAGPALAGAAEAEEDETVVAPGRDELAALCELASLGDFRGLQAQAAQLEQRDRLGPFARRLGRLAGQFEPEQARALIARCLRPEE